MKQQSWSPHRWSAIGALGISLVLASCAGSSSTPPTSTSTSTTASTLTTLPKTGPLAPKLALFPFGSPGEVDQWRAAGGAATSPWHLSPGATAVHFAAAMGFSSINTVLVASGTTTDVHVTIGQVVAGTSRQRVAAAIVHVLRWGTGAGAPFEVIGTDDTTLSITAPPYGGTIDRSVVVGGHVTGVDEALRLAVRSNTQLAGQHCCLAAGGAASPWSYPVTFAAPSGALLVVVVSTGGHVASVERFAVTGAWAR